MPPINIANAGKLQNWLMTQAKLIKAWGCTSVGVDICICTLREYTGVIELTRSGVPVSQIERKHVSRRASTA